MINEVYTQSVENVHSQSGLNFIEQLHAISTSNCAKENRPYLTGISEPDCIALLTRPSCKQWDCPSCAAKNAKRWIARVINHINRTGTVYGWHFFTLTAHEKMRGVSSSVKNLREGWKKLYNRILRKFGVSSYVKVWEAHNDGSFHLHGLMDAKIAKRWLKNNARECGMGYQVDIRTVSNAGQVAGYISKYMVKSGLGSEYPKGLRRIEVSRDWIKLPDLKADTLITWLINQTRDGQLRNAQHYYERGFDILDMVKVDN